MSDNKPCIIYDNILKNRFNGMQIKYIYSLLNDINILIELEIFDNLGFLLCNDNLLNNFSDIYNFIKSKETNNIIQKILNGLEYMYNNQDLINNSVNMLQCYNLKDIINNVFNNEEKQDLYYTIAIFKLIKPMY